MVMVQKVLRNADPRITSERYAHLEQDYLGAETRKPSLIAPSRNTGQTRREATAEAAAKLRLGNVSGSVCFERAADGILTRDPELARAHPPKSRARPAKSTRVRLRVTPEGWRHRDASKDEA